MRSRSLLTLFALLAVAAGCAPSAIEEAAPQAAAAPAVDLAAEEQAVRDASVHWEAAEQERDLLTVMSFMHPDVTAIFDGRLLSGYAEFEAATKARWQEQPDSTLEWTTSAVVVAASGDLAYERGSWSFDPDGDGAAEPEKGEYVCVWQKVDGEWKVVVDAGSTITADRA